LQLGLAPGPVWLLQGEESDLRRVAGGAPIDPDDPLLRPLVAAGLLTGAGLADHIAPTGPTPGAGRTAPVVEIRGAGRLGSLLAGLLASTGDIRVTVRDAAPVGAGDLIPGGFSSADLGHPSGVAATQRAAQTLRPVGVETPRSLVILADGSDLDPAVTDPLLRNGVPHLPLRKRGGVVQIGPLARGDASCLRCLDHHRTDADPEWPALAIQLLSTATEPVGIAQATVAAGIATEAVLRALRGDPADTVGWVPPDLGVWFAPVAPHPACGCRWFPANLTEPIGAIGATIST
jgi:hypothetical protein